MPSRKKTNRFLVVWDMLGLESIFNIDDALKIVEDYEKDVIWKKLKEEVVPKKPNPIPLQAILMRARVNTHRSYEVYSFTTSMNENEVRKEFARDPQPIVNWIRENGNKIYSDKNSTQNQKIF